jgi:hypothetical protein
LYLVTLVIPMKKLLSLFIILFTLTTFAQQPGRVVVEWTDNSTTNFGDLKIRIPKFNSGNFNFDGTNGSVFFVLKTPITTAVDNNALQITDVVFETIQPSQLGDLKVTALPSAINAKLKTIRARDQMFAQLTLSPIIKDASGIKRVKSFTYAINASASRVAPMLNSVSAITNSIFASGDVYRFYVEKSGVYKISKNFLQSLGMNTSVDPRKIKVYGNGGHMAPLGNDVYYPADPEENAIQFVGEGDGIFDSADYILFYAEGMDTWNTDSQTHNNLYADRSYYYVTSKGGDGKRIQPMDPLEGSIVDTTITSFDDYQYHERDLVNIVRLGRRWFGEQFSIDDQQEFDFEFPNIDTSSPIKLTVYTAASATVQTTFAVSANSQAAGTITIPPNSPTFGLEVQSGLLDAASVPAAEDVTIGLAYNNGGVPTSKGYLDYIILRAKSFLKGYGRQFHFKYDAAATTNGVGQFQFSNASGITQVWDVTDIYNVTKSENAGQANFSFKVMFGELRKYIAVDQSDYYAPQKESKSRVANQDLKGTVFNNAQGSFQDIDYVIVTPGSLYTQAEKLANFWRNYIGTPGMNVKTVKLENIYEEFGSGKQDIGAIRNFVKYVYENASTPAARVKYLNLFGDASFDFKDRIPNNSNVVPIYQALNSFTIGQGSFASDDFFGLMDADEGRIDAINTISDFGGTDIAVGRMIANDANEADELVNKVIDYHDLKSYGSWRNNIVMISDDADKDSDEELQIRQNSLTNTIVLNKPFINAEKILLDSYEQETSAGGNRYPKARQDIFNAFEKGALVFNYLGHGGEDGLSGERIWEKSDGQNLQNRYRYPLFITITCEFSRFDNPYRPTAGEYTYWNPRGGAIAMLTTIRSIDQHQAQNFNDSLAQYLFGYGPGAGTDISIAEALRRAKNVSSNSGANVVVCLGDPALKLAIPKPKIRLTKVNGAPVTGPIDDFESLDLVTLTGEVTDEFDNLLPTYNGELAVNIFDKPIMRQTLNNDNFAPPISFQILGETIFRGNATINSGLFQFQFVVPRDIRIPVGNGRISFYAKRNQILLDKTGYDTTIKIGGINENAAADNIGPTVKLYMNDTSFVNGGITNENPIFLAFLNDTNGINTASGIGHDIVAILDGDESNPYILNDYYETLPDDYANGKLRFPFRNLAHGLHTITFKAWDVYNNPVTAEIQFVVVGDDGVTLTNVLNYPNPFTSYTQFWFTHNRPFEPLDVQVQVLTVTGKVVWSKNQTVTTDGFLSREITWDGKDDFGDRIGKGVYIYKLTVRSNVTGTKSEKYEKLVIL